MATTLAEAYVYFKGDDKHLESSLDGAEKKTESAAGNMAKFLGGAVVAGAAVAGAAIFAIGKNAFDVASEIDAATDQIGASLGLGADEAAAYGESIKAVYGDNFGDSIADVGSAVEVVAKQLKLAANDPSLAKMTSNAFRLRDAFGTDVADSIDAVTTLTEQFGISNEKAFDLVARGYQTGLDRSGDFLDTIGEYSTQFAAGGASVEEFFALLESGSQGGMLGTDKAADAFKEFRVRIMEGTDEVATWLDTMEGIVDSGVIVQIKNGTMSAADAFELVIQGLQSIEDPIERHKAGIALMGTQYEDLGGHIVANMTLTGDWATASEGAVNKIDTKYTNLGSVAEGMWRKFQVGIAPAGEAMLGFVNENLPAIEGVIGTVSGKVVTFIGLIPLALAGIKTAWDTDWGNMQTTVNNFVNAVPLALAGMWAEIDLMFQREGDKTGDGWENFWGGMTTFFSSFLLVTIDSWTEALRSIRSVLGAFSALFQGDWDGMWNHMYNYVDSITNQILNLVEFWFGPELRNKLTGALHWAWDGMKGAWESIAGWWNNTFGELLGITVETGAANLGIVNPLNQQEQNFAVVNPVNQLPSGAPDGWVGAWNPGMGGNGRSLSVNVNVGGADATYDNGREAGRGVLDEMRSRGY